MPKLASMIKKLKYDRVCFIGMSGVGKSSFGKKIATKCSLPFLDTDNVIQSTLDMSLQQYIETHSEPTFLKEEERIICTTSFPSHCIIATGGSVIYSKKIMRYLHSKTCLIYLQDTIENIEHRITCTKNRGIIMHGFQNLQEVYQHRMALYKKWAHITIDYPPTFKPNLILSRILNTIQLT